ncbi:MAG: AI-2E family transporter [Deltaproteobacteria bacterium]|nr:MAG: AI-2E family transporter [Deltaproteobacteria bacterium]
MIPAARGGTLVVMSSPASPWRSLRRFGYPFLWFLVLGFFFLLREIAAPFIGAILIAYLLSPLVSALSRWRPRLGKFRLRIHRWVAVLIIYFGLGLVAFGYVALAVPRIGTELGKLVHEGERFVQSLTPEKLQQYAQNVKDWIDQKGLPVQVVMPGHSGPAEPAEGRFVLRLDEIMGQSMTELATGARQALVTFLKVGPRFAVRVFRSVLMTFLILMVAAFLMIGPEQVFAFFRALFPPHMQNGYDEVLQEIDIGLAGVVRGQVLICLVNGVLTFIGLVLLGVKFPVLLSSLAAVMSLIPIFGSVLSSIPIVAVALTSSFGLALAALAWIIGIHLLEANLLNPKIIGDAAKIHPALVVFVLLAGEHFYGVLGALFAVPLTSVALAVFKVMHRRIAAWRDEGKPAADGSEKTPSVPAQGEQG